MISLQKIKEYQTYWIAHVTMIALTTKAYWDHIIEDIKKETK